MGMICCIHAVDGSKVDSFHGDADAFFDFFEEAEDCMDFDKSWHAIHFMLTGSAWEGAPPLNFITEAGSPIEGSDSGYGEARAFNPAEIELIASALSKISEEEFIGRFNGDLMAKEEIYPSIWDRKKEENENKEYILENFRDMKEYIKRLALLKTHMMISVQ